MVFSIFLSEEAESQLKKLDNSVVARILEKLDETTKDPVHFFERLTGREEYKLRIGNYRIIANIMNNDGIIFVRSVGHRKKIYKD